MQYLNMRKAIGLITAMAFYIGGSHTALAVGTAAGTDIDNTATVDYQVSGDARSASDTITFRVDNRVDLTVVEQAGTYVGVSPGDTGDDGTVLEFLVTNTGNQTQDYALSASASTDPFNGDAVDDFDVTGVAVYVEDGTTAGYQSGEDTATFIDELAADGTATVYIVGTIPAAQADGDIAAYLLTVTTHDAGAAGLGAATDDTVANTTTGEEVVFADGTGDSDVDFDGQFSDRGAFQVSSATVSVTKTISSVDDGFGGSYAIPGALVTYQITVDNTGSSAVDTDTLILTDTIPANTRICVVAGTICAAGDVPAVTDSGSGLGGLTVEYSDDNGVGWAYDAVGNADADGTNPNVTDIRLAPTGAMSSGGSFDLDFTVIVD